MKLKFLKTVMTSLTLTIITFANITHAGLIPSGIHNDVEYNTVVNDWGWDVIYRDDYSACDLGNTECRFNDILSGVKGSDFVMFASIADNSSQFDVLASALWSDISTFTLRNAVHAANGTNWYFNNLSVGFTAIGTTIEQASADINGLTDRFRLSWHSGGVEGDVTMYYGWRSGNNIGLNLSTAFDRVILVKRAEVPEPSTLAIFALGMMGLASRRFKKQS
jgi:hypothetical protein